MGLFDIFKKKEKANVTPAPTIVNSVQEVREVDLPPMAGVLNLSKSNVLNLSKNSVLNLSKVDDSNVTDLDFGCGWMAAKPGSPNIDIDLSAASFDSNGRFLAMTYFGNKNGVRGVTSVFGDNTTGEDSTKRYKGKTTSDDEMLAIDFSKIESSVEKVVIFANIYSASSRGQHFGQMKNAYVNVYVNGFDKVSEFKLDNFDKVTGVILVEFYPKTKTFKTIGKGKAIFSVSLAERGYNTLMN